MTIIQSKKFQAALLAALVAATATYWELDVERVLAIISPILVYIFGQGLADMGKEL